MTIGQDPKERILSTALELFVEKGYFNTNIPDISAASKCSIGSIYHHFVNKEEIATIIYHDCIQKFRSTINEVIDVNEEPKKVFKAIVIAFLYFVEQNKSMSKYLWLARHNEFLTGNIQKPTIVGFDILGRQLTRIIKRAISNGDIAPINAELIWTLVFGLPLSYVMDWLDGSVKILPSEIAPMLADASWVALTSAKKQI